MPFLFGVLGLGLFVWGLVRFNATKPQPGSGYGAPNGGHPQQGGHGYPYSQPGQPPYPQQGPPDPGPQGPDQPPYDGGRSER